MRALLLAALLAAACASAGETRLSSHTFQIVYKTRHNRSPQEALSAALRRAAEITLREGFEYFAVVDRDASESYRAYDDMAGKRQLTSRSTATLTFRVIPANDGEGRVNAYSARMILRR
jgi:hypothetical protein